MKNIPIKNNEQINIERILSSDEIELIARKTGFLNRKGKISPFDFLLVLIFRLATSVPPALRLIASLLETPVSRIAVHYKFTNKAVEFMKSCLQRSAMILSEQPVSTKLLNNFSRVMIFDSTSWDVSAEMKAVLPGSGGCASAANCKLQVGYDFKSGSILHLEDTKGTEPDQNFGKQIGRFINKGDLVLIDLGYWTFETFSGIASKEGFFVSRFNTQANVWMETDDGLIKADLINILKTQKAVGISDIEMEILIKGRRNTDILKVRLSAFRAPAEVVNVRRAGKRKNGRKKGRTPTQKSLEFCEWSIYITNVPENFLPAEMMSTIYRIRWEIELVFKSWKSILRMHLSNVRKNHHRLQCELYAKLILAVIVHSIHRRFQFYAWNKSKKEISFECLWKFVIAKSESFHNAMKLSCSCFFDLVTQFSDLLMYNCEKYHQPLRKTTLQKISELIGNTKPIKIYQIILVS